MTREDALKKFEDSQKEALEQYRQDFANRLPGAMPILVERLREAFEAAGRQAEEREKEEIVYFQFSLLRCDLARRKYRILLTLQDIRWFLDPEEAEVLFPVDFLFAGLDELWERLKTEQKKYMGKVNSYDVDFMMQELAAECNSLVGNGLRYALRDVEDSPEFAAVKKAVLWDIRWGEYCGPAILAARVDRIPKTGEQWKEAVLKSGEEKNLSETCWYQMELSGQDCRGMRFLFTTFEECVLRNIDFTGADLTGARFKNCTLEDCSFEAAALKTAYFEHCVWNNPEFKNADLEQALFTREGISQADFDEKQLSAMLVTEGGTGE